MSRRAIARMLAADEPAPKASPPPPPDKDDVIASLKAKVAEQERIIADLKKRIANKPHRDPTKAELYRTAMGIMGGDFDDVEDPPRRKRSAK